MAEQSIFWTTGGAGDGASPYTQTQVTDWLRRTFLSDPANEGVLAGYANGLAVSGTSSPISVAAGAAIVYGVPYENTAPVSLAVPTPTIGPTGHRVVLRVNWAARTVRLTLLSSSNGVALPPAPTQTAGTTWDIPLARLTIAPGGAITMVDERAFAHPNLRIGTNQLDDGGVTGAKLAENSVDDTRAGSRVPQFYRRQGGHASDWSISGTTTYTPEAVRMQAGRVAVSGGSATITFPVAFSGRPVVVLTPSSDARVWVVGAETSFVVIGASDPAPLAVSWLAIGPE